MVLQEVVGGEIELDADGSVLEPAPVHQPDGAEDPLHGHVGGQGLGHQAAEPGGLGDQGEVLQQDRRHAFVVVGIGDGKGDLGFFPAMSRVVLADAEDRAVGLGDECHLPLDVVDRGSLQLVVGDGRPQAEEPGVGGRGVELSVEGPELLDIRRAGGADVNGSARRQQHVTLEVGEQRRRRGR